MRTTPKPSDLDMLSLLRAPVRRARRAPQGITQALVCAAAMLACEDAAPSAPKSRVQAVPAGSASAAQAEGEHARRAGTPGDTAQRPAASAPRVALCAGQLQQPGSQFSPTLEPESRAAPGAAGLPARVLSRTKRWTWVNLWAAWCVPCKEELPLLLSWQAQLGQQVDFRFVSLDDDERQLTAFLANEPSGGLRASYWLPDGERRRAWLGALGIESEPELPMQLLIDPDGKLRCKQQGTVASTDRAVLERLITR